MVDHKCLYAGINEGCVTCGQKQNVPPVESLDSIDIELFAMIDNVDWDDREAYGAETRKLVTKIRTLIQTSNSKAVHEAIIKQALRSAAELSILDQEVMSLKAEIKRLQTLTKELPDG